MESQTQQPAYWRKCTTCKKTIGFNQKYWICSVSTCNRQRTGLVFCNVICFDAHVPVLNHRDAGAFEKKSPTEAEWKLEQNHVKEAPKPTAAKPAGSSQPGSEAEILVVVSKMKDYVRKKSGMNTSDAVSQRLSTWVVRWCDEAIRRASQAGRQTVLDRDVL
jgi:hypothetical protein